MARTPKSNNKVLDNEPETQEIETPITHEEDVEVVETPHETEDNSINPTPVIDNALAEKLKLAKELNLTVRTNPQTGEVILPSTPAMRAAAARQAVKPVQPTDAADIHALVEKEFGEKVAKNPNIQLVVDTLSQHVKLMGPTSTITEEQGGEAQAKLANLYDVVLGLEPDVAQIALSIIVTIVKKNLSGAFKETMALRFANTTPLNNELAVRFQLLTTLFITLASGTTKKDLAKVLNVRHLLDYISDRKAKANLSEFIN